MHRSDARRPSTDDAPARLGPYRLIAPLGRGGMGVVYRAEHEETKEQVALKTVGVTDPNLLSSIRREIHALRRVDHPGVVRVVGEGVEAGLPWYAMELLEGRTLRDHNLERWRNHTTIEALPSGALRRFPDEETQVALTGEAAPEGGPPVEGQPAHVDSGGHDEGRPVEGGRRLDDGGLDDATRTGPMLGPTRGNLPAPRGIPLPRVPSERVERSPGPTPPTRVLPAAPSTAASGGVRPETTGGGEGMPPRTFRYAGGGELPRALSLFRAMCRPLAYIHGLGLVHRDLKPENVFIRGDGTPVLVDFGLAVKLEGSKGRGELELQFGGKPMGSPSYMAPEQIRGDLVDARADLYAVGCMLYEAVTGTVPFTAANSALVLSMHLYAAPLAASSLVEGVPPALDALLQRLLQKRAEDRIGYADDLAMALAELGAVDMSPAVCPAWYRAPKPQPYLYRPGLAGRGDALRQLYTRLARLQEGQGGLVFLAGESGIGKTRLAMETATEAARLGVSVVTGECMAVSAGEGGERGVKAAPLHPLRHLLLAVADRCRAAGFEATSNGAVAERDQAKADATYDALLGPRGRLLASYEPALAQLEGHERYPEPPPLPADAASFRLRSAVAETLAALAAEGPLLLILDDLQWADDSSLGVLELLDAAFFAEHRVLILCTYRSEEASAAVEALSRVPWALTLSIGRLDARAVSRMVSDMLAMDRPPERFVNFLLQQSEGNPFFTAEYLHAAVEEGMLYRDGLGTWRIRSASTTAANTGAEAPGSGRLGRGDWGALTLPGSLRALVARRLSGLSPGALALLRMASVLGRELEELVLIASSGADDVEAMEGLAELSRRHVLETAEPGHLRFVHDKLREIAYAEIPDRERLKLHTAAAIALEARYAASPDLPLAYPQLAHHFAMAGAVEKALEYLERAGDQALATGASAEARELYRRAIALDDGRHASGRAEKLRRARWERRLGQANYNLGDLRDAERHCVQALSLLERPVARVFEAQQAPGDSARKLGEPYASSAETVAISALQLGRQLLHLGGVPIHLAQEETERERLAEAALAAELLSETYLFQNKATLAFVAALEATNAAAGLGPSPALARGYATLSVAFGYVPWTSVVNAYAQRAEQTAAASRDGQAGAFVAFMRGLTALGDGRCQEARVLLERAEQGAERVGNRRRQEECLALLGTAAHFEGAWAEALARFATLQASARRSNNAQGLVWANSGRSQTLIVLGDGEEAAELLEELLLSAEQSGDRAQQITLGQLALAHALRGDRAAALQTAERTLGLIEVQGKPAAFHCIHGYAATCEVLLSAWEQASSPEERARLGLKARRACAALRQYAQIFPVGRPDALRLTGVFDWLMGHPRRARRGWQRSAEEATRLGLPMHEGFARFEMRRLPAADAERRWNLVLAEGIFERLGINHWRSQVEAARSG
ncbi:serine/threonine-protein kinase PknK [Chondromyces crocatus]|uniref:Protein kinase n=1 Tax=Chondromyces crocatus TaxID=52 RepID=A0A0K1ESQ0_CHOCO|nr:serine/threonine-protein kinase [Chondromyces crocatus]AKT43667.1 protein kinase [Chondromyces crocatus]